MDALILVDLQNDFMPGGPMGVAEGEQTVPIANELMKRFDVVIATQDWHPANHGSFASQHQGKQPFEQGKLGGLDQTLWPDHCVQGSVGSNFQQTLDTTRITKIFKKGTDPGVDSYSGFFDNGRKQDTGLADYLRARGVRRVFVMGLATDYCVKFTALDAADLGFDTVLVRDGCRGVNLNDGDSDRAIEEMREAGVSVTTSGEL